VMPPARLTRRNVASLTRNTLSSPLPPRSGGEGWGVGGSSAKTALVFPPQRGPPPPPPPPPPPRGGGGGPPPPRPDREPGSAGVLPGTLGAWPRS
jgi:hypothetical protein